MNGWMEEKQVNEVDDGNVAEGVPMMVLKVLWVCMKVFPTMMQPSGC